MNIEDQLQIMRCKEYKARLNPKLSTNRDEFFLYDLLSLDFFELRRANQLFYRVLKPVGLRLKLKNQLKTYNTQESIKLLTRHKKTNKLLFSN